MNHKKSKILIFEPRREPCNSIFKIGFEVLERVYSYRYLGIVLEYTGHYKSAKNDLYMRSQKAYFKLRKLLGSEYINPKLFLDVFDKTVLPVLLYNSEMWSSFNMNTKRYKENMNPNFLFEEFIGEKLHTKLCKILLGVGQNTSNLASRSELGRYPIMITMLANMITYKSQLEKAESSNLIKDSYNDDILLDSYGLSNWYSCTEEILKLINANHSILKISSKTLRKKVILKLQESYDQYFKNQIFNDNRKDPSEQNKLRTFRKFKNRIKYEPYLNLNIKKDILKKFTQFRLSSHKLQIELARHIKVPGTTRVHEKLKARKCKLCNNGEEEDELHFMLKCQSYANERTNYLNKIFHMCKNTKSLSMEQLFIWLNSNEDTNILNLTVKFINSCFLIRDNLIKKQ